MRIAGMLSVTCVVALSASAQTSKIDFQRDVRPILTDACFHCHGPDRTSRMAGLRLDLKSDATAPRKNGAAIVPGSADKSVVWQRVNHAKPALRMPPPYSHKTLTDDQKETLRHWIEQGAPWKEHWAFSKPVRAALPPVRNAAWVRNTIDQLLLARMEAAGLQPNKEADRRTLARRVALDLTGLPPRPEEVEAFVNDGAPDAYEKLIDRYLESPRYGEHRARYWLDAARYADTHGIHIDNYREIWPYRDWVIKAFNANMPFDRFTVEQIAGDLLPNRTVEQQIATGFHRCNPTTNEAGAIEEEFAAIYAKDRVDTTSAVWLGLTLGCATCHDHKFDPLTQKDFYAMTAFFRNTVQPVMDGNVADTPPVIAVPAPEHTARWERLDRDRQALLKQITAMQRKAATGTSARLPAYLAAEQVVELNAESAPASLPEGITRGPSDAEGVQALHFKEAASVDLPNLSWLNADRPFTVSVRFLMPKDEASYTLVSQSDPEDKGRGWGLDVSGGRTPGVRITGDDGKAISARAVFLVQTKPGTWNTVAFTYDGSRHPQGLRLYVNGQRAMIAGGAQVEPLRGSINTGKPLRIGAEAKRSLPGGAISEVRIFRRELADEEVLAISNGADAESRKASHLLASNAAFRELVTQRRYIEHERSMIARISPITHVMEERQDQKPFAHILNRGMYDQPKQKVEPDVPGVLPRMKPGLPRNRLGLAQWLMDEDNPLTARVTVNRYWQEVFGQGLVGTADDFGSQGELPAHPELLDWLAVEFRESGWDVKRFFKLLLTSAAYRQSAQATPEKLKADPENKLLSRGPRFRMDGEVLRDAALAASGLLSPKIGGPSVKPYQPPGVWEAVAMDGSNTRFYKQDSDDGLYRRSMYWFWKRSAPPASMDIFNAPTRELCTVRRERTNTPLQALVMMNDTQFVEAARNLAQHAMASAKDDLYGQFNYMSRRVLARPFDDKEYTTLRDAHRDYLGYYRAHPDDARKLLHVGESRPDEGLDPAQFAAMTMIANQVLNLDEALVK